MKRVIKFKAWDSYQKKMIQWEELSNPDSLSMWNLLNNLIEHIKPLQYIEIKDKNGEDIYDGDILKDGDDIGVVVFSQKDLAYVVSVGYPFKGTYWCFNFEVYEWEIIGNIHKNPELLIVE